MTPMVWNEKRILRELRRLHKAEENLAYTHLARKNQSLLSAAAYHFGSYRDAIAAAGIDYRKVLRRPRWTKQNIIALIKQARRDVENLHWSAVTRRRDELKLAAFASLQRRLFGSWDRALTAAGLDADEVAAYRKWDRNLICFELRSRRRENEPLNSAAVQQEDPSLHAAAVRYFGEYDAVLRRCGINPNRVKQRKRWSRDQVISGLRKLSKSRKGMLRKKDPALYGAALRLFGSIKAARRAAKIRS
jgi:hypothetical protein